ncbi:MAG: hypothetical protein PW792_15225 [Acidobacteriaceae bacterium]|nr:hypothetical protein [Acidobacteriaceae bacterium]
MYILRPHRPSQTEAELAESFDLPRYSRRDVLWTLASLGAVAAVGCGSDGTVNSSGTSTSSSGTSACVVGTNVTRGPYFVDGVNDTLDAKDGAAYGLDSLIPLRTDIRTDSEGSAGTMSGVALTLTITINNVSCNSVLSGYRVDIWHCNGAGAYSDILNSTNDNGLDHRGQNFLRGYQYTDSNGQVTFTTVYPGAYSGRCPHIHIKVRNIASTTVAGASVTPTTEATTQIFFTDATSAAVYAANSAYSTTGYDTKDSGDSIYKSETTPLIPALTGSTSAGYTGAVSVGIAVGTVSP